MGLNNKQTLKLLVSFSNNPPEIHLIKINGESNRRVNSAKLLGNTVSSDLTWRNHVDDIYSRAARWLYSLIMLHKSGLPSQDMLDYYLCKIRPIVEYASQVWHGRLTLAESTLLETIQRRALRIIYSNEDSYTALLIKADLAKLSEHRKQSYSLFNQIQEPHHKLHHLLPHEWINSMSTRNATKYEPPKCRTERNTLLIQFPVVTRILCFINGYENTSFTIITWTSLNEFIIFVHILWYQMVLYCMQINLCGCIVIKHLLFYYYYYIII